MNQVLYYGERWWWVEGGGITALAFPMAPVMAPPMTLPTEFDEPMDGGYSQSKNAKTNIINQPFPTLSSYKVG